MNYYSKAISILDAVSGSREREHTLLLEIAKTNPSALVKAEHVLKAIRVLQGMTSFERAIVELAKTKKIQAIKELRAETGLGLKDSKEKVEYLCSLLRR